jgi:hypothetical protein
MRKPPPQAIDAPVASRVHTRIAASKYLPVLQQISPAVGFESPRGVPGNFARDCFESPRGVPGNFARDCFESPRGVPGNFARDCFESPRGVPGNFARVPGMPRILERDSRLAGIARR